MRYAAHLYYSQHTMMCIMNIVNPGPTSEAHNFYELLHCGRMLPI